MKAANTRNTSRTDWERLKKMRDRDIDHSDVPPLDASFFKNATIRLPERKGPWPFGWTPTATQLRLSI